MVLVSLETPWPASLQAFTVTSSVPLAGCSVNSEDHFECRSLLRSRVALAWRNSARCVRLDVGMAIVVICGCRIERGGLNSWESSSGLKGRSGAKMSLFAQISACTA